MDILNFISWIKGKRLVTTVDPAKTLLPVALKDDRRDDDYLTGAISVEDLAAQVGGLQTVAVDGTTIQGDGTPTNPLFANVPPSTNIYNSDGTLTGNRTLTGGNNNLIFNDIAQFRTKQNNFDSGITLDWNNGAFYFGAGLGGGQSGTALIIEAVGNERSRFWHQNNVKGVSLDFITRKYLFGQINGNNATSLTIDDAAAFPVQVSGTNVSANTAGGASGQFLKIKVNGVDYKIDLLNP